MKRSKSPPPAWLMTAEVGKTLVRASESFVGWPDEPKKFGKKVPISPHATGRLTAKHEDGTVTVVYGENLQGGGMKITCSPDQFDPFVPADKAKKSAAA